MSKKQPISPVLEEYLDTKENYRKEYQEKKYKQKQASERRKQLRERREDYDYN